MKTFLLIAVLGGILVICVGFGVYMWQGMADTEISGHGIAALALGVFFTLALGIGLMSLAFYSSRHGHDERANEPPDED